MSRSIRFSLNRISAPRVPFAEYLAMCKRLGVDSIEIRNDLPGVEILRAGIRQENLLFKIRMGEQLSVPQAPTDRTQHQSNKGESL